MSAAPPEPAIAVFGGSFDPPHLGHVAAVRYLATRSGLDRVLAIPVFSHAFSKDLAPFEHRVEMCRLAFAGVPGAEVSRVEERLGAPSRSLATLAALAREHPEARLRLVVGSDVIGETHAWHRWDAVVELAPPFVLLREGFPAEGAHDAALPDVSSTRVRGLLHEREGAAASDPELVSLVPRQVLDYVDAHGLYR
jgi:nicotinate-nucleotide adenylyltransferase